MYMKYIKIMYITYLNTKHLLNMCNITHSDLMSIGNVVLEGIKNGVQKKRIEVRCKI